MDQEKIGKLIAKLRKEKGLTQRELGEKVGVGYRAVSKWETGLTTPDICIINELSAILGISSDELLKGELINKEANPTENKAKSNKKKMPKKKKLLIILLPSIIIITLTIFLISHINTNEVTYTIVSQNLNEYSIDGTVTVDNKNTYVKINKIEFEDYHFRQMIVKDYRYNIFLGNEFAFGINYLEDYRKEKIKISVEEAFNDLIIDCKSNAVKSLDELENTKAVIKVYFIDEEDKIIEKTLEATLVLSVEN